MLPWVHHDIEEIKGRVRGRPFPYGNRGQSPTLEALLQYMASSISSRNRSRSPTWLFPSSPAITEPSHGSISLLARNPYGSRYGTTLAD